MDSTRRARLVHLLLAKSLLEALVVSAIAVGFYFATTNPQLRGVVDKADSEVVTGWAVNESQPAERIDLQLFIDDQFVAHDNADQYRPDVHESRRAADDWHGFLFKTPKLSRGAHEARVYAVHRSGGGARLTLQLIGKPYRFSID